MPTFLRGCWRRAKRSLMGLSVSWKAPLAETFEVEVSHLPRLLSLPLKPHVSPNRHLAPVTMFMQPVGSWLWGNIARDLRGEWGHLPFYLHP